MAYASVLIFFLQTETMNSRIQNQPNGVSEGGKRMLATTLRAVMSFNQRNIAENAKTKNPKKWTIQEREALARTKYLAEVKTRSSSF